jgi:hypothetical protein
MGFSHLLLSLGAFVLSTGAWKLDTKSCGARDADLGKHLRSSMEDAFDVASGALTELQKPQRSAEVNRLLELLFSPEGTAGEQYDVAHLVSTFLGIRAMSEEVEGDEEYKNKNDFVSTNSSTPQQQKGFFHLQCSQVLFCNGDRIKAKTDKKGWTDTYSGYDLSDEEDPCTKTGAADLTLAETYQMDDDWGSPLAGEPSDQLQICPWFLEWYQAQTYKVRFHRGN